MAFFVDSVTKAADGNRTAPDWWHELKQAESQKQELSDESRKLFARVRSEVFGPNDKTAKETASVSTRRGFVSAADVLSSK